MLRINSPFCRAMQLPPLAAERGSTNLVDDGRCEHLPLDVNYRLPQPLDLVRSTAKLTAAPITETGLA
jgi:hypothetical protein